MSEIGGGFYFGCLDILLCFVLLNVRSMHCFLKNRLLSMRLVLSNVRTVVCFGYLMFIACKETSSQFAIFISFPRIILLS